MVKNMKKKERAHLLKVAAMRSRKIGLLLTASKKTDQQIADGFKNNKVSFLSSQAWKDLRKKVVQTYGHKCMKCGYEPSDKRKVNVDHIKPRKFYPDLALCFGNLQVLCAGCNKEKGNKNQIDYRLA